MASDLVVAASTPPGGEVTPAVAGRTLVGLGPDPAAELVRALPEAAGTLFLFGRDAEALAAAQRWLRERRPQWRVWGLGGVGAVGVGDGGGEHAMGALFWLEEEARVAGALLAEPEAPAGYEETIALAQRLERELGLHRLMQPRDEGFVLWWAAGDPEWYGYVGARLRLSLPYLPIVGFSLPSGCVTGRVLGEGRDLARGMVLLLVRSVRPFSVWAASHGEATARRVTITRVGARSNVVEAIDGYPAASYLRRHFGACEPGGLVLGAQVQGAWMLRYLCGCEGEAAIFSGGFEVGSVLRVMRRTPEVRPAAALPPGAGVAGAAPGVRPVVGADTVILHDVAVLYDGIWQLPAGGVVLGTGGTDDG